ncbi:MAG: hypothetical protein L6V89_07080 [Oscillospiraceae bacterium]|nr:MAG: hypothetical protein L6V89_07080 [Oscillospiraceae bacterium]
MVLLPSVKASTQDAINYTAREALEERAVEESPTDGKTHEAAIDTSKGLSEREHRQDDEHADRGNTTGTKRIC